VAVQNHKETCNSCKFFSASERMGACKRYPKPINKANDDWCGEFIYENLALEAIVSQMTEPPAICEPKKRGRPAKRC
jgi:hypothetical protein